MIFFLLCTDITSDRAIPLVSVKKKKITRLMLDHVLGTLTPLFLALHSLFICVFCVLAHSHRLVSSKNSYNKHLCYLPFKAVHFTCDRRYFIENSTKKCRMFGRSISNKTGSLIHSPRQ